MDSRRTVEWGRTGKCAPVIGGEGLLESVLYVLSPEGLECRIGDEDLMLILNQAQVRRYWRDRGRLQFSASS